MRIDLQQDHKDFVKQIAEIRGFLNKQEAGRDDQAKVSARFAIAAFLPFLPALRTELRGEPDPAAILTATSDLIANLATTLIESMYDAPVEAQREALDRIIGTAHGTAMNLLNATAMRERDAAERAKPKLAIVNGGKIDRAKG